MYIKGFIANLEKHLEGELIGEWITFPISEEELNADMKKNIKTRFALVKSIFFMTGAAILSMISVHTKILKI